MGGGKGGVDVLRIFNFIKPNLVSTKKFRLLASLELSKQFSVVVGGGYKVTLVFCFCPKPKVCTFDLDLDQAEQKYI